MNAAGTFDAQGTLSCKFQQCKNSYMISADFFVAGCYATTVTSPPRCLLFWKLVSFLKERSIQRKLGMSSWNSEECSGGSRNSQILWEGYSVLLDINNGDRVLFARLKAGSKIKIRNKNYSLQPLIGCPFGAPLQVEDGKDGPFLRRVIPSVEEN